MALHGQNGPDKLEGVYPRSGNLVPMVRWFAHPTIWPASVHYHSPLWRVAVSPVDRVVEANIDGSHAEVIVVQVENGHGGVVIFLCRMAPAHMQVDGSWYRLESEDQIRWSSCRGEHDVKSRVMTLVRRLVRCLQSGAMENESGLLELGDSCRLLEGTLEQGPWVGVGRRVSRSVHVVVKQACHGKANGVDDHPLAHPASQEEVTEPGMVGT